MTQPLSDTVRYEDHWYHLEFRHPRSEVSDPILVSFREAFKEAGIEFSSGRIRNGEMNFFSLIPESREILKFTFGEERLIASRRYSPLLNPPKAPEGLEYFLRYLETVLLVSFSKQDFPLIYQQEYTFEKIFSCSSVEDSLLFIGKTMLHLDESHFQSLERLPGGLSVQFIVPPKIQKDPSEIIMKVRTSRQTPKILVLSCKRRFFTATYSQKDIPRILDHARDTKALADEKGLAFLTQFL